MRVQTPKVNCSTVCLDGTDYTDCLANGESASGESGSGESVHGEAGLLKVAGLRQADFGPRLYEERFGDGIDSPLALAQPQGACMPLTNAVEVAGKLALVTVSTALLHPAKACSFVTMASNVQQAGAIGVSLL